MQIKPRNERLIEYQEKVIELYESGISMVEISKMLKKNFRIISFIINISGIKINRDVMVKPRKNVDSNEVLKLYEEENITIPNLAKKYNVCEGTIKNRLREARLMRESL